MTELLQALDSVIEMTSLDENTSRELRGKIERAVDNYHILNTTITRIETRFVAAEERLGEKINQIGETLKNMNLIGQDIVDIRSNQKRSMAEHVIFKDEEYKHQQAIERIERRLEKYELIIKILSGIITFLMTLAVPLAATVIKHIFGWPNI